MSLPNVLIYLLAPWVLMVQGRGAKLFSLLQKNAPSGTLQGSLYLIHPSIYHTHPPWCHVEPLAPPCLQYYWIYVCCSVQWDRLTTEVGSLGTQPNKLLAYCLPYRCLLYLQLPQTVQCIPVEFWCILSLSRVRNPSWFFGPCSSHSKL
jgi:hypothetical protein